MGELTNIATEAVAKYISSADGSASVAAVVKKSVDEAIRSALGYGSEFDKQMKANDLLLRIIERQVQAATEGAIERRVAERMKQLLTPAPETIKLSELIEQYRLMLKDKRESGCVCYGDEEFDFQAKEGDYGFITVLLNEERNRPLEKRSHNKWGIHIGIHPQKKTHLEESAKWPVGPIYHLAFGDADVEKRLFAGPFYGFERLLFQMKAAKTQVIVDVMEASEINTSYASVD